MSENDRIDERASREDGSGTTTNRVALVGQVSGPPTTRTLPSGDVLTTWRLVVRRPVPPAPAAPPPAPDHPAATVVAETGGAQSRRRPPGVDTFDCAAWSPRLQESAAGLVDGELVAVDGALRRRFWRAGASVASRVEVDVQALRPVRGPADEQTVAPLTDQRVEPRTTALVQPPTEPSPGGAA